MVKLGMYTDWRSRLSVEESALVDDSCTGLKSKWTEPTGPFSGSTAWSGMLNSGGGTRASASSTFGTERYWTLLVLRLRSVFISGRCHRVDRRKRQNALAFNVHILRWASSTA